MSEHCLAVKLLHLFVKTTLIIILSPLLVVLLVVLALSFLGAFFKEAVKP